MYSVPTHDMTPVYRFSASDFPVSGPWTNVDVLGSVHDHATGSSWCLVAIDADHVLTCVPCSQCDVYDTRRPTSAGPVSTFNLLPESSGGLGLDEIGRGIVAIGGGMLTHVRGSEMWVWDARRGDRVDDALNLEPMRVPEQEVSVVPMREDLLLFAEDGGNMVFYEHERGENFQPRKRMVEWLEVSPQVCAHGDYIVGWEHMGSHVRLWKWGPELVDGGEKAQRPIARFRVPEVVRCAVNDKFVVVSNSMSIVYVYTVTGELVTSFNLRHLGNADLSGLAIWDVELMGEDILATYCRFTDPGELCFTMLSENPTPIARVVLEGTKMLGFSKLLFMGSRIVLDDNVASQALIFDMPKDVVDKIKAQSRDALPLSETAETQAPKNTKSEKSAAESVSVGEVDDPAKSVKTDSDGSKTSEKACKGPRVLGTDLETAMMDAVMDQVHKMLASSPLETVSGWTPEGTVRVLAYSMVGFDKYQIRLGSEFRGPLREVLQERCITGKVLAGQVWRADELHEEIVGALRRKKTYNVLPDLDMAERSLLEFLMTIQYE